MDIYGYSVSICKKKFWRPIHTLQKLEHTKEDQRSNKKDEKISKKVCIYLRVPEGM